MSGALGLSECVCVSCIVFYHKEKKKHKFRFIMHCSWIRDKKTVC